MQKVKHIDILKYFFPDSVKTIDDSIEPSRRGNLSNDVFCWRCQFDHRRAKSDFLLAIEEQQYLKQIDSSLLEIER